MKLMYQVGLVEIAAIEGECCPVNASRWRARVADISDGAAEAANERDKDNRCARDRLFAN
jgi:hypothetical protein